jgi:hypothetical protein
MRIAARISASFPATLLFAAVVLPVGIAAPCIPPSGAAGNASADHDFADHYFYDPILKRSWAVVRDCRHPERPSRLVPVTSQPTGPEAPGDPRSRSGIHPPPASGAGKTGPHPGQWVMAGSPVRLWASGQVRIELAGVAVDSAPLGAEITVRTREQDVLLHGIVRGAGSVELAGGVTGWKAQ